MSDEKRMSELIILSKIFTDTYQNIINSIGVKFGLNLGEANTLLFFFDNPDCFNAIDFKNNHHVSKAYVSKAINSLLEKKLIKLIIDDNDKRYQKVEINENALVIINALNKERKDFINSILSKTNEKELDIFFEVLRNVKENIINMEERK